MGRIAVLLMGLGFTVAAGDRAAAQETFPLVEGSVYRFKLNGAGPGTRDTNQIFNTVNR